jgi:DNA-binding transcriptional regulator YiaG
MNICDLINRDPVPSLPCPETRAALRRAFGITQIALAKALGVSRQTVRAWEKGEKEPAGDNRQRYSELLRAWQDRAAQAGKEIQK